MKFEKPTQEQVDRQYMFFNLGQQLIGLGEPGLAAIIINFAQAVVMGNEEEFLKLVFTYVEEHKKEEEEFTKFMKSIGVTQKEITSELLNKYTN